MENTHSIIKKAISRKKPGEVIFPSDFRGEGTDSAIKKALSRLSAEGAIKRAAHGIYYIPKTDPLLGELRPDTDEVVDMIAKKEKIRIKPAGAYALHQLGLTTQVPSRRVYVTDGNTRQFKLGKLAILFKATTSKRLLRKGKISSLVIQALEELGPDKMDKEIRIKIKALLLKEDPKVLKYDLGLTSVKVNNFIVNLLKK